MIPSDACLQYSLLADTLNPRGGLKPPECGPLVVQQRESSLGTSKSASAKKIVSDLLDTFVEFSILQDFVVDFEVWELISDELRAVW